MDRDDLLTVFGLYVMGVVTASTLIIMWLMGWIG